MFYTSQRASVNLQEVSVLSWWSFYKEGPASSTMAGVSVCKGPCAPLCLRLSADQTCSGSLGHEIVVIWAGEMAQRLRTLTALPEMAGRIFAASPWLNSSVADRDVTVNPEVDF